MKILVIGSGGREHALIWCLARSGHEVVCAPGNPGISALARCLDIRADALADLEAAAQREAVDLVVIGPEAPLVAGLADRLRRSGVAVFGPGADGARLEGSKIFSKEFFQRHGIPTAPFRTCESLRQAEQAIDDIGRSGDGGVVVKADGLAGGKGVVVCSDREEARRAARDMLEHRRFGAAGARLVIEQRLRGRELSIMAITDGVRFEMLAQVEDHKALGDGDQGPNTGGMGTVSPPAWGADDALVARIAREVFEPTLRGLAAEGIDYRGVLYAGLMIDEQGQPWMLEYNCRFGDPETQPVLARLRGDLGAWLAGAAAGALPGASMTWDTRSAVCVILAAAGYPEQPRTGDRITGPILDVRHVGGLGDDVIVFHAGTAWRDHDLVTAGGRVLGVTALAADLASARARAYDVVARISFPGMQFRRDIGARDMGARNIRGKNA
jgi:phosphoribosylamine--glycine ligase